MASPVKNESVVELELHLQDVRISKKWNNLTKISLTRQDPMETNETVGRVINAICSFFSVENSWDRRLFESLFSSDPEFNWFECKKTTGQGVIYAIKILPGSDRDIFFGRRVEPFQALDRGSRKVHVRTHSKLLAGENSYDLTLGDLQGKWSDDLALIALYNSESFLQCSQHSTNRSFTRSMQIFDPSETTEKKN